MTGIKRILVLIHYLMLLQVIVVFDLFAGAIKSPSLEKIEQDSGQKKTLSLMHSKESENIEGDKSTNALKQLSNFLSENYEKEFRDGQDVSSFVVFSSALEQDRPWFAPILGEPDERFHNGLMIDNRTLGGVETIRLFEHINAAIDQNLLEGDASHRLKLLFEKTDVLMISLFFRHWPMDRICYHLTLEPIEKFVSFFPNIKKMYLRLDRLTDTFRLPISSNIQNLQTLHVRLIEGFKNVRREKDTLDWYQSWPDDLLEVIKRNVHLSKLSMYTPGTKKDFLEKLGNIIRPRSEFSNLVLFNPNCDNFFMDTFNFCEQEAVYFEMFKNILTEAPQLGAIRFFASRDVITSLNHSELDEAIHKAQEDLVAKQQKLKATKTFFGFKIQKIWTVFKKMRLG